MAASKRGLDAARVGKCAHDGVRKWFAAAQELTEYRVEERDLRSEGAKVIVHARVTLRSGEGAPLAADVVYVFEVHDRKVTSLTTSFADVEPGD